ncbi:MAG TPA: ABC transporter substrate-binding protein [Thermomicrobiales bacterium]|nr:ABC transporter substrate-binding protein [Thermomicrobiales bacterium]
MSDQIHLRFATRFVPTDPDLAERQWAEWRTTRRRLLQMGIVGGGLALAGLGGPSPLAPAPAAAQDEQPKDGGTITMSLADQDVTSFDPPMPPDNMSIWTMLLFYDQLLRPAPDGKSLEPALAEAWDVSEDGKTYTFHLRDAKFHDGSPVTAEDVAFCLKRASTIQGSPWSFMYTAIDTTEAPDPKTAVVKLKSVWVPFEADVAMFAASIFPKKAFDAQGAKFFDKPIGSGPFIFDSREPDVQVVLKKNPNYWDAGKPHLDGATFKVLTDANARMLQFQGGELDIVTLVPYNQLDPLKANPDAVLLQDAVARIDIISIQVTHKPFDDKKLRQAMNYAVNKDAIIQNVLFGAGELATSFLPKMPGRDPDLPGYPCDLDKAKELVAQSAGKDGFKGELIYTAGDTTQAQICQLVAADLAQIGGQLTVTATDGNTLLQKLFTTFDFDLCKAYYTTDIIDPDELASFAALGAGGAKAMGSNYSNPEVDKLILQAQSETDKAKRQDLYNQIQKLHLDDAPFIFLFYPSGSTATQKYIKNFHILPTGNYRLWETWRTDAST